VPERDPLKIALVEPYDWSVYGGVQQVVAALDRTYRALGHEVRVVAPFSSGSPRERALPPNLIAIEQAVLALTLNGSKARMGLSLEVHSLVRAILAQEQFDVIHMHEPLMPTVCLSMLLNLQAFPGCVVVGTFHCYRRTSPGYVPVSSILNRWLERLDGRIAVSEAARGTVLPYLPGDYRIIPNGVDVARFDGAGELGAIPALKDGRLNVLFVGRLDKRKGFAHLLQAFEQVQGSVPAARLIVVGSYSPEEAQPYQRIAEAQQTDVRFVGRVSDEDLARYYHTADVVCFPSIGSESFGIVLLEAMAAGRPVVASNIIGYREVMRHEVEGLFVPPKSDTALAAALIRLLRDEPLRRRLGDAGRVTAQRYSWDQVGPETLDFYYELRDRRQWALSSS
jgi:phosphatidyl-myo-inositol alpha-mannosyltransferase